MVDNMGGGGGFFRKVLYSLRLQGKITAAYQSDQIYVLFVIILV